MGWCARGAGGGGLGFSLASDHIVPVLMRIDPSLAAKGLGRLGAYEIPADLWHRVVPPDFVEQARQYNVEEDPEGG